MADTTFHNIITDALVGRVIHAASTVIDSDGPWVGREIVSAHVARTNDSRCNGVCLVLRVLHPSEHRDVEVKVSVDSILRLGDA